MKTHSLVPLALMIVLACALAEHAFAQDRFRQTNGPYGGRLFDYVVGNDGTVYAVTDNFDVYRSDNGGISYTATTSIGTDSVPQWIEDVATDSSGTLYIGGDHGVWRSDDKGVTWTRVGAGLPRTSSDANWHIMDLATTLNGTVIATYYIPDDTVGLFRSTDRGATFQRVDLGLLNHELPSEVIATPLRTVIVNTEKSLWRSTDAGATWTRSTFTHIGGDTAMHPAVGRLGSIYLTTVPSRRILVSTDDGVSFSQVEPSGLPLQSFINSVTTTANGTLLMGVATYGGYRSVDGGASFVPVQSDALVSSMAALPSGPVVASSTEPFRSVDDGVSFDRYSDGLISTSVQRMMEGGDGAMYAMSGQGAFRSDDTGRSWRNISIVRDHRMRDMELAADGALWSTSTGDGVARSTDRGASWTFRNSGLTTQNVYDLEMGGPGVIYAATDSGFYVTRNNGESWTPSNSGLTTKLLFVLDTAPDGSLLVGTYNAGMARSTDGGTTWSPSNTGLLHPTVQAITVTREGTVFVGTGGQSPGGIYRSMDSGQTWQHVAPHHRTSEVRGLTELRNGTIYVGSYYLGRSTDNGHSWSSQIDVPFYNYFIAPWILEHSSGRMFFGTLGAGVGEILPDAGDRWSKVPISVASTRSIGGYVGGYYYAGTPDGIYLKQRYSLRERLWTRDTLQIPGNPDVKSFAEYGDKRDQLAGRSVYAITSDGLYRSSNRTAWWKLGQDEFPPGMRVDAMAVNHIDEVLMLATSAGMWRSQTAGDTWTPATEGPTNVEFTSMLVGGSGPGYAFAATREGRVYRSSDWGWSWTLQSAGLPGAPVLSLAASPKGVLFAGTSGSGIYRSSDNGGSWSLLNALDGRAVNALTMNSNGILFAGTDRGVYRSADGGATFARVNTDHNGNVFDVHEDGRGMILAATDAGLFHSTPDGAVAGVEMPARAQNAGAVLTVAGNPLGDRSRVLVGVKRGGHVRIDLVDLRGTVCATLADDELAAGEYAFAVRADALAAGAYFVRLAHDSGTIVVGVSVE